MVTKAKAAPAVLQDEPIDRAGWKYRWNDDIVDEDTFNNLTADHHAWIAEQEKQKTLATKEDAKVEKKKAKKK